MTKEKLDLGNRLITQIENLKRAEIKPTDPHLAGPIEYSNLRAEFIDVEDYNGRVRLKIKQLEETLASL